jgi:hypothetical protein
MDWPGNPIATLWLGEGGWFVSFVPSSLPPGPVYIDDSHVTFTVQCNWLPQSTTTTDMAYFFVEVFELANGTSTQITASPGSVNATASDPSPILSGDITFTSGEMVLTFAFSFYDETSGVQREAWGPITIRRGPVDLGSFTLDYVPAAIVYCPPGQDMTASLTQSRDFGTRLTVGQSDSLHATQSGSLNFSTGIASIGIGSSDSQSVNNKSTSGVEISHFRNTIVTADNQRAIGRAYWGPLGDIFVILVNPQFALSQNFDGSISYQMTDASGDLIILPAWKLLRPRNDPIASAIPESVREQVLALDPFITNLPLFFPDSGADLSLAANPAADPTANERAELIGSWWPDNGIELNYTIGDSQELEMGTTQEVDTASTVTLNVNASFQEVVSLALSMSAANTTTIGYQSSLETQNKSSVSASCLLIRNQNDRDIGGIEVYYDRVFSTLMFRQILADRQHRRITGYVKDVNGTPMPRTPVTIQGGENYHAQTYTNSSGQYRLSNVPLGEYSLLAGGQAQELNVTEGSWTDLIRLDVSRAGQVIDLSHCSIGQLACVLGIDVPKVQQLLALGIDFTNLEGLAGFPGIQQSQLDAWRETIHFISPDSSSGAEQT